MSPAEREPADAPTGLPSSPPGDAAAALVIFAVSLTFFVIGGRYSGGSGAFPRAVAILLMTCSALLLLRRWLPSSRPAGQPPAGGMSAAAMGRIAATIGLSILYVVAVGGLGYIVASLLFIPACAIMLGYRRPLPIAATTVLFVAVAYLLFTRLLHAPLPANAFLDGL